ncbi:MAG: hypothetical protein WDA27_07630 [Actinomycetota bacterium]
MELSLIAEEAALLQRVLTEYVSDLHREIAGTDSYEFRQGLKRDEEVLKKLLDHLTVPASR